MGSGPETRESTLTVPRVEERLKRPSMWRVLLHNDDYTTQEFVVWVLQHIFHKPQAEAFAIMLSVHQSGLGVAGVFTHDMAATKVQAATDAAEQEDFPLLVTMEPDGEENSE
jgi:ATP-dependent Clp protease adaptor protein ClpS